MTNLGIDIQENVNRFKEKEDITWDDRHGGPYDRGGADSYYRRGIDPHYFIGATYQGTRIEKENMSEHEVEAYMAGYNDNELAGDHKDWG